MKASKSVPLRPMFFPQSRPSAYSEKKWPPMLMVTDIPTVWKYGKYGVGKYGGNMSRVALDFDSVNFPFGAGLIACDIKPQFDKSVLQSNAAVRRKARAC